MNQHNHHISSSVYKELIKSSPQINHTIFNPYGKYFESWDQYGTYWRYTVYKN